MISQGARLALLRNVLILALALGTCLLSAWAQSAQAQVVRRVFPPSAEQGTTVTLNIAGEQTTWDDPGGVFVLIDGDGITVGRAVILGDNAIEVLITIAGNATAGARNVSVVSSGRRTDERVDFPLEIAEGGVFTIVAAPATRPATGARILGVFPAQISRGTATIDAAGTVVTLTPGARQIVIAGANSNFLEFNTVAAFSGSGITYNLAADVISITQTTLVLRLSVDAAAPLGFRDVTIITGRGDAAEIITLANAFQVVANDLLDVDRPGLAGIRISAASLGGVKNDPATNSPTFENGDEFILSVNISNDGDDVEADFYVAVELPDGRVLFLTPDGEAFVPQITPYSEDFSVTSQSSASSLTLFSTTIEDVEPGIFTVFTAFTEPGTLELIGQIGSTKFLLLGDLKLGENG